MNRPILLYITTASLFIPPITGIYRWKALDASMKFFAVFCLYTLIHTIVEMALGMNGINNHFLLHYYTLVEFSSIMFIYYQFFTSQKVLQQITFFTGILFVVLWWYDNAYFVDPKKFDDFISTVSQVILTLFSFIVLQRLYQHASPSITQYSIFWIATAVLFCYTSTIIIMAMSNRLLEMGMGYFTIAWSINWVFTIIANLLFTRSFFAKYFR